MEGRAHHGSGESKFKQSEVQMRTNFKDFMMRGMLLNLPLAKNSKYSYDLGDGSSPSFQNDGAILDPPVQRSN